MAFVIMEPIRGEPPALLAPTARVVRVLEQKKCFEVRQWPAKVVSVCLAITLFVDGIERFMSHRYGSIILPVSVALLFLYMGLSAGTYKITEEAIEHRNIFGRFRMAWADVRSAEVCERDILILYGEGKRFNLALSLGFSADQVRAFIASQFEKLGITPSKLSIFSVKRLFGNFSPHKNVRIH